MNTQLVESLAETILTLSPAEQNALWQKLDHLPSTENTLLQKIAETLPTAIQQRYNINTVEQFDADRLQHLIALAQHHQISLPELLNQLKISPPAVYA
jgi:hypothetical protein